MVDFGRWIEKDVGRIKNENELLEWETLCSSFGDYCLFIYFCCLGFKVCEWVDESQ